MAPNQPRPKTGAKAKPYPISVYPATIDDMKTINRSTGESLGAIVRRLVEAEIRRLLRSGVATWEVLTFPSYHASGEPIPTVVVYRTVNGEPDVIKAVGDRLLPEPPAGSLVVVRRSDVLGNLYGRLVGVDIDDSEDEPKMALTVDALPKPAAIVAQPERRGAYLKWIEDVFKGAGEALGVAVPQTGSDRTLGRFRIAHTGALNDAGSIGWSVLSVARRRGRRLEPVIWDSTNPLDVVAQLVDAAAQVDRLFPD